MEDVQPNERRLSRKGSTTIPRVHAVHTPYYRPCGPESRKWANNHYPRAPLNVKAHRPQSDEPGPSRSNHMLQTVVACANRRSSFPSSSSFVQRQVVESSTAKAKSCQAQIAHANPIPRHPPLIRAANPPECIIDLTLDPPSPSARANFRWSTFRSGQVVVQLPRSSNDPVLRSETDTDSQLRIQQEPDQCRNTIIPDGDDMPHSASPTIHANVTVPIRPVEDSRTSDSPSDPLCQLDVLEATRSSNCSMVLKVDARLFPDGSSSTRGLPSTRDRLPLPLGPYDKPRCILHSEYSAYIVTAHGFIDRVNAAGVLQLDRHIRTPQLPLEESVDDACILSHQGDSIVVLGHAREKNQLTVLDLRHSQAPRHIWLPHGWNAAKLPGVSAVTTLMTPLKFASGGRDHRVHIWDIAQDLSGASAVELAIKHTSVVHSLLAIKDTSHKLVSVGADRDAPIYDMSVEHVVRTLKMSSIPYHAHKADSPFCTLFEVAHLETQFEVYDHRYPLQVVQRFGFITEERRGRYEKADTWSHFVACGDKNGTLHVWDLRNVATEIAVQPCFSDPVVQVVNTGPCLLVCSKRNELACLNLSLGL